MTPLYNRLKNGISFYCFPSAAEDINNDQQNENFTISFSKFALLNLPKEAISNNPIDLTSGIQGTVSRLDGNGVDPIVFDFENVFYKTLDGSVQPAATFSERLVESLRNYVANQEVTIKNTKTNDNDYFYDTTLLKTTAERIFFKWARKLNLIQLEAASNGDEYFGDLPEFERINSNDDNYLKEYLWRERKVVDFTPSAMSNNSNKLRMEYTAPTNYRIGDIVKLYNFANDGLAANAISGISLTGDALTNYFVQVAVINVIEPVSSGDTQKVDFDYPYTGSSFVLTGVKTLLVYNRLVQYIGEITSINNVKQANKSYTDTTAYINDHVGKTPDVLFRTLHDNNYQPNLIYPILPEQYQPEIVGAENFNSPIVSNPTQYVGDYFAQYDKDNNDNAYNYLNGTGDILRRTGDYFGVFGDINNTTFNAYKIDGISLDFDTNHYVKMNVKGNELTNFDEFNALNVNNQPPEDFEFNAILWYYTSTDINGNSATNLYGISILDMPENNPTEALKGIKVPTYKKYVNDGIKDGTAYGFSVNQIINVNSENVVPSFDPENINNIFGFDLYNEAMRRLASANSSFNKVLSQNNDLMNQINAIKSTIYNQNDLNNINAKIANLEKLLLLYQSLQLSSSDTILVIPNYDTTPPTIEMRSKDQVYSKIEDILVTQLYNNSEIVPYTVAVPEGKNFYVRILNDDTKSIVLNNDNKLSVILQRDLDYKQSVEIDILSTDVSNQNKKIDIYVNFAGDTVNTPLITTKLFNSLDIPIGLNSVTNLPSLSKKIETFKLNVVKYTVKTSSSIEITVFGAANIVEGEHVFIHNFIISANTTDTEYSGLYYVNSIQIDTPNILGGGLLVPYKIVLDVSNNKALVDYIRTLSVNDVITVNNVSELSLYKGVKLKITRVAQSDASLLNDRYFLEKFYI